MSRELTDFSITKAPGMRLTDFSTSLSHDSFSFFLYGYFSSILDSRGIRTNQYLFLG